jgi:hypothetical protein
MNDGFRLPPEQLRAHAGKLDRYGDALNEAADAARGIRLDGSAYGKINDFFPAVLNAVADPVSQSIDSAHKAMSGLADSLRAAIQQHEVTDAQVAGRLQRLIDELGG